MKVRDVMHRAATWIGPDAPLPEVVSHISDEDVVPICQYDRLVGEVSKRNLTDHKKAKTARDVMSRPFAYCYPEEDTKEALRIMRKHAVRRLPVISHQRRLIGTVWLDDVKREGQGAR